MTCTELTDSGNPASLGDSLIALAMENGQAVLGAVSRFTGHDHPYVRSSAATALGIIGGREVHEQIKRLMEDPDRDVRYGAVLGLGKSGDSRALFCLANYYDGADRGTAERVLLALEELADPRATSFLERIVEQEEDPQLLKIARNALDKSNAAACEKFIYTFHGPEEITAEASRAEGQIEVKSYSDVEGAAAILEKDLEFPHFKPQTYVVTLQGAFVIGGYINEHVMAARGMGVLAAGEAGFEKKDGLWQVTYLNNRSNGYYPGVASFRWVKNALDTTGVKFPSQGFTETYPLDGFFEEDFLCNQPFYRFWKRR